MIKHSWKLPLARCKDMTHLVPDTQRGDTLMYFIFTVDITILKLVFFI